MSIVVPNRIFIRDIPQSAKKDDLAAHFAQFGATTDVFMPLVFGQWDRHKGMCFVTFESPSSAELALQVNPHVIQGHQVTVETCLPKKGAGKGKTPLAPQPVAVTVPALAHARPASYPLVSTKPSSGDRLFISNISPEATQDDVSAYFAQWGPWTDLFMPRGSYPTGHKGVCFISYTDSSSAQDVLAQGPHVIRGQTLVIDIAAPRGAKPLASGGSGRAPGPWAERPVLLALPHHAAPGMPLVFPGAPLAAPGGRGPPQGSITPGRLFLTRMPPDVTKEDLANYFRMFGELEDVYIPPGTKPIAFVSFKDPHNAQIALQLPTHEVKTGRIVHVDAAVERPSMGAALPVRSRWSPY